MIDKKERYDFLVGFLIFLIIGLSLIFFGLFKVYYNEKIKGYIKTKAIITESKFESELKGTKKPYIYYLVKINYEYYILNNKYNGYDTVETVIKNDARYAKNNYINILYDKKSERISFITEEKSSFLYLFLLGFGIKKQKKIRKELLIEESDEKD